MARPICFWLQYFVFLMFIGPTVSYALPQPPRPPQSHQADTYDAQPFTSEDGIQNAHGRVLGGSNAVNAGFYSRVDDDFYKKIGVNWDLRVVNQSYEWVERAIVFRPELKNWQSVVRDGLLEAGVDPYIGFSLDNSVGSKIGEVGYGKQTEHTSDG
ncbi:(R)-mandelonitrile lyase-like [Castanea sativa]|uniref:(R)-mandelonitrile lyase-like n=1 Tax=Castanea sativa TaxID=21020 RepID=UPI003F651775